MRGVKGQDSRHHSIRTGCEGISDDSYGSPMNLTEGNHEGGY